MGWTGPSPTCAAESSAASARRSCSSPTGWLPSPISWKATAALEAVVRQAKSPHSEAQQMRDFIANGGSLSGLVQKHCEIWAA